MGTVGDCYDNAPMESFWGSMQIELLNRQRWRTNLELAVAIADYIEHFYNPARRHSALATSPRTSSKTYIHPNPGHVVITRGPPNGVKALGADDGIRTRDPNLGKVGTLQSLGITIAEHRAVPTLREVGTVPQRSSARRLGGELGGRFSAPAQKDGAHVRVA